MNFITITFLGTWRVAASSVLRHRRRVSWHCTILALAALEALFLHLCVRLTKDHLSLALLSTPLSQRSPMPNRGHIASRITSPAESSTFRRTRNHSNLSKQAPKLDCSRSKLTRGNAFQSKYHFSHLPPRTPFFPLVLRCPTNEELLSAKRWVDEKKRMAFSTGSYSMLRFSHL